MNLSTLAAHRAQCAAHYEYLDGVQPTGDPEEQNAHHKARAKAKADWHEAEKRWQKATSTFLPEELASILAAGKREAA